MTPLVRSEWEVRECVGRNVLINENLKNVIVGALLGAPTSDDAPGADGASRMTPMLGAVQGV